MEDIQIKLKDIHYYNTNKKKFNFLYNKIWKSIAGPEYIGTCSLLFQNFFNEWYEKGNNSSPTYQDFCNYYTSHTNPVKSNDLERFDSVNFGRTKEELVALAKEYQKKCNDYTITLESYFDDIVNHAIIETFDGQIAEMRLIKEYRTNGYEVEQTNGYWDKTLGVDLIIKKSDEIVDYIQCKPISTFLSDTNESLVEDRKYFFKKEKDKKEFCEKHDMIYKETKFVIYDKYHNFDFCIFNGKKEFLLEELCNDNGKTKFNKKLVEGYYKVI